jgi:hypothetical protein
MIQLSFAFFFLLFWMSDMKSIVINKEKGLRIIRCKARKDKNQFGGRKDRLFR